MTFLMLSAGFLSTRFGEDTITQLNFVSKMIVPRLKQ